MLEMNTSNGSTLMGIERQTSKSVECNSWT